MPSDVQEYLGFNDAFWIPVAWIIINMVFGLLTYGSPAAGILMGLIVLLTFGRLLIKNGLPRERRTTDEGPFFIFKLWVLFCSFFVTGIPFGLLIRNFFPPG